jgi:hypothetical protein
MNSYMYDAHFSRCLRITPLSWILAHTMDWGRIMAFVFFESRARGLPCLHAHTQTHTHTPIRVWTPDCHCEIYDKHNCEGRKSRFPLGYFWHTFNYLYHRRKIVLFTYCSFLTRPVCRTSHRCAWHSLSPVRCTKITGCIDFCWLAHGIVVYIKILILSIV